MGIDSASSVIGERNLRLLPAGGKNFCCYSGDLGGQDVGAAGPALTPARLSSVPSRPVTKQKYMRKSL